MSEHIDRIRAFAHWIAQGKGHATQEAVDAMALLADYDALAARLAEVEGDAALGRIAIKFVDRAGDVCEVDPADRICREFHAAMSAEVERQFRVRMQRDADSAPGVVLHNGDTMEFVSSNTEDGLTIKDVKITRAADQPEAAAK